MQRVLILTTLAGACLLTGGCASIVSGQNQSVSVTSRDPVKGVDVAGAKCALVNDKGTWYATTPGTVTVRRSFNELAVNCTADGMAPGIAMVKSATKAMAFGNILFGGFIGAGVDMSTGAAYDYPEIIVITMGQTGVVAPVPAAAPAAVPAPAKTALATP